MTIDQIVFFNHYHNGDLFHSKPFISDLMHQLNGFKFSYYHGKDVRVLADLGIPQFDINRVDLNPKIQLVHGNMDGRAALFINTWIGAYFDLLEKETGQEYQILIVLHAALSPCSFS